MTTEHPTRMDPEAIKQAIDLVDFAQGYTQLRQISRAGEYAGPCPRCGGEDRFHVKGQRFYCRQCYPRGGDVIDLVQILHHLDFREACRLLMDTSPFFSERPIAAVHQPSPPATPEQPVHAVESFHESAYKTMLATSRKLFSPDGAPGRAYLYDRGLTERTCQAYRLGFGLSFHPLRRRNEPAIFIPWLSHDGQRVEALRLRFIEESTVKAERYALKPGSTPVVFGQHLLRPAAHLVIVEGEFNCMALQQQGVMALSLGSQTGTRHPASLEALSALVKDYADISVWFDDPAQAQQLMAQMGEAEPFRKKSWHVLTSPQDANELLMEGELAAVLAAYGIVAGSR